MPTLPRYLATFAATILFAGPASAALFDNVYLFGDSLLDGGNAFAITHGFPPYPGGSGAPGVPAGLSGRLTNGPTAGEILALDSAILGTPVLPSYVPGGTNYAVAGATTREYVGVLGSAAPPPLDVLTPPTMTTSNQIARGYWYFDDTVVDTPYDFHVDAIRPYGITGQVNAFTTPAGFDANRSLFTVWGGANDFFVDAATGPAGAANVISFIDTLYGQGCAQLPRAQSARTCRSRRTDRACLRRSKLGLSLLSAAVQRGIDGGHPGPACGQGRHPHRRVSRWTIS